MTKILPSAHLLEAFMPYLLDEKRMLPVIRKAVELDYYKGLEIPLFWNSENQREVRAILSGNCLYGASFCVPYLDRKKYNLSSPDAHLRKESVAYAETLVEVAAEMGLSSLNMPSGPDSAPEMRETCKAYLADSFAQICKKAAEYGISILLEPLDRYAFKKKLLGPIKETCEWFAPIHAEFPDTYIHWDSAHEALGKTDLIESLSVSAPLLGRIHLCDAILDESHPCFGDLHMDVAAAPDFETEGFLTPDVAAEILAFARDNTTSGLECIYASMEILGHPGDDLWHKEARGRAFLQECFRRAGI